MRTSWIAVASAAAVLLGAPLAADAAPSAASPKEYVASWSRAYAAFVTSFGKAYRPCATGPTPACGAAQAAAGTIAAKAAARIGRTIPPKSLYHAAHMLRAALLTLSRDLAASAVAARAGNGGARVWCSGEQGPCRAAIIDIGNAAGDIGFIADVDLPLPAA